MHVSCSRFICALAPAPALSLVVMVSLGNVVSEVGLLLRHTLVHPHGIIKFALESVCGCSGILNCEARCLLQSLDGDATCMTARRPWTTQAAKCDRRFSQQRFHPGGERAASFRNVIILFSFRKLRVQYEYCQFLNRVTGFVLPLAGPAKQ